MNITVEEAKTFKEVSNELLDKVKQEIENLDWKAERSSVIEYNGLKFEFEGISYDVRVVEEDCWEDGGKYQYSTNVWQLVSFDKNICKYACEKSIIDKYNLFMNENITRSGSYFSDYWYQCDKPNYTKISIKNVLEMIIPAHEKIEYCDV